MTSDDKTPRAAAPDPPATSSPPPPSDGVVVESSPQDKDRTYLSYTLPGNNLRCLLISDPTTDKAAAAMDVRVGYLSDPDGIPGLAHFCEHMLFLGTEKYPDENEYNKYLQKHGGHSNAFTDTESTNYYFDVGAQHLEGALDRFAQFFISPLFTSSATDREMNAIESEHSKNLQSDHWRTAALHSSLARGDHPYSKFGTGNIRTLRDAPRERGVEVRDKLLEFHAKYYSAGVMRLVVLGRESLDELRDMAQRLFADVKDKGVDPPVFPGSPYPPESLGRRIDYVPVQEKRELDVSFPLRETLTLYKKKPLRYISHLIGHEGKGSILALLREKGWANELSAGESRQCSDWTAFSVGIDLTDEGLAHVEDVASVVFAYLNMLRVEGPQRWVHDETATVADTHFRFLSKREPMDYVCGLAGWMQVYPEEHSLSGPYKIWEYDPEVITECLEFLKPNNAVVGVASKNFEGKTSEKEEWYGVEYNVYPVEPALLQRWENASIRDADIADEEGTPMLSFPEKNDMIATDFELRSCPPSFPSDEPRLLFDSATCRLWYKPDNVFEMPKVNVMATLRTSEAYQTSVEASVLAGLYADILREHTTSFSYLATMAGLHCSFVNTRRGIELHVSGYNHKADVLMKRIVDAMIALPSQLEEEVFLRIKDKVSKQFANFLVGAQPYQHAFYGADLCLEETKWSVQDKMAALESISSRDVVEFAGRLTKRFHLEMLVHGNASPQEAQSVANIVLEGLKPSDPFESSLPALRVIQLEKGRDYLYKFKEYNPRDPNSCLENVYQVGRIDLRTNAALALVNHLLQEPAFDELRTKEQLGYIVHCSVKTTGDDAKGLLVLIMSDSYDPVHLDERVEAFLVRFRSNLVHMTAEEFDSNINAVATNFLEKNKNLGEESGKYWTAVTDRRYIFRRLQLIGEEVKTLSKNDVLVFFDKFIARGGACRSKLSVQVFAQNRADRMTTEEEGSGSGGENGEEGVTVVTEEDVVDFKRSMPLYPLPSKVDVEGMRMSQTTPPS